jgi:hypothetical protein
MAAGNHLIKGHWALLVKATIITKKATIPLVLKKLVKDLKEIQ